MVEQHSYLTETIAYGLNEMYVFIMLCALIEVKGMNIKMKDNSLKQNFMFQLLYQILIYAIPLIISPYLTRTLGGNALGIYTYSNSIAYYFLLFINLGINKHGQRVIAANRDNDVKLRRTFWGLFSVHTIVFVIGIVAYIVFCIWWCKENRTIFLIQTLYILSAFVDITWLFYGLENFKTVAIKNIFVKMLECLLIFTFVKGKGDLAKYTFITSGAIFLGQLIMIPQAFKSVKFIRITIRDIRIHIKPMIILFASTIASTLYTIFDKTLLGVLSSNIQDVAFYEYSNKIITIPKIIICVVGTVVFPRACKYAAYHDKNGQKKVMRISCTIASVLGVASVFGLAAIASKLAIVYYGSEFAICGNIMTLMTPLILIVSLGDTFRSGYLIPCHMDNIYVISNIISAVVNLVVSSYMIQRVGIYGVVWGTLLAEIIGFFIQAYACKNIFTLREMAKTLAPSVFVGLVMYCCVSYLDRITADNIMWLGIEIIVGIVIYFAGILIIGHFFYSDRMKEIKTK